VLLLLLLLLRGGAGSWLWRAEAKHGEGLQRHLAARGEEAQGEGAGGALRRDVQCGERGAPDQVEEGGRGGRDGRRDGEDAGSGGQGS
jgi:hypothetical protein